VIVAADPPTARSGPGTPGTPVRRTVLQGGRQKAFRPLPAAERRGAWEAGLAAFGRGDFFEAHEILEPAWMGTDDLPERELYQGVIKIAAAFVHGVRGNPRGIARNLEGARERLAATVGSAAADASGIDVAALLAAVDERLAQLAARPDDAAIEPPLLVRRRR
jgi:predicted metal-dependent hydrolase